jgi:hypothetical protein
MLYDWDFTSLRLWHEREALCCQGLLPLRKHQPISGRGCLGGYRRSGESTLGSTHLVKLLMCRAAEEPSSLVGWSCLAVYASAQNQCQPSVGPRKSPVLGALAEYPGPGPRPASGNIVGQSAAHGAGHLGLLMATIFAGGLSARQPKIP